MKHVRYLRYIQIGWLALLILLLVGLIVIPVGGAGHARAQQASVPATTTSVNATIYITPTTLKPMFQTRINQQVPGVFSTALNSIVSKLPAQDQGWAQQMATTLLQPSASLTGLSTQSSGIVTSLSVSLYPGDPHPISANMLVSFTIADSSTVLVTAKPIPGNPTLVNGPISTLKVSIGQLNSIATTPNCGDSALGVNLKFPVVLGSGVASSPSPVQVQQASYNVPLTKTTSTSSSYVELPSSSLAAIGNSVGNLPITSSLTAKNIQIGVSGSNMIITSSIYDSFWGNIGTALTTVQPLASGGNLAVHVLSTTVKLFGFFNIPYNTYNNQIQQMVNAKLNGALTGKFYVTSAAIGANAHVPCARSDSLVLTGIAANLG